MNLYLYYCVPQTSTWIIKLALNRFSKKLNLFFSSHALWPSYDLKCCYFLDRSSFSSPFIGFCLFVCLFLTCQVRYRKCALHFVRLHLILANIQKIEKPCLKEKTNGIKWSLKCQHETWRQRLFDHKISALPKLAISNRKVKIRATR